jgi:hypothetical protein
VQRQESLDASFRCSDAQGTLASSLTNSELLHDCIGRTASSSPPSLSRCTCAAHTRFESVAAPAQRA